jgi:hypothetical protein
MRESDPTLTNRTSAVDRKYGLESRVDQSGSDHDALDRAAKVVWNGRIDASVHYRSTARRTQAPVRLPSSVILRDRNFE